MKCKIYVGLGALPGPFLVEINELFWNSTEASFIFLLKLQRKFSQKVLRNWEVHLKNLFSIFHGCLQAFSGDEVLEIQDQTHFVEGSMKLQQYLNVPRIGYLR